jgi:hypothetical protein
MSVGEKLAVGKKLAVGFKADYLIENCLLESWLSDRKLAAGLAGKYNIRTR